MSYRWYLVYCKPRQEQTARVNLGRQGYESYLPLVRQARKRQGRRITVVTPMFPRYLFIHLSDQTDNWGPIRSTLGVVSLVRFGMKPAQVPEDLIATLRKREDEDGIQILPLDNYRQGARIRITEGGFAGYEGIFLARSGTERVTVLLNLLGRQIRTRVDIGAIEPAT
jgi:transcriptional antiterminator RfaH